MEMPKIKNSQRNPKEKQSWRTYTRYRVIIDLNMKGKTTKFLEASRRVSLFPWHGPQADQLIRLNINKLYFI